MKSFAKLGDVTTTGGQILSGQKQWSMAEKPYACVGDDVYCPSCGQVGQIAEGENSILIKGKALAFWGAEVACGCQKGSHRISPDQSEASQVAALHQEAAKQAAEEAQKNQSKKDPKEEEEEMKLFVATVFAEAAFSYQGAEVYPHYAVSSDKALEAVASVILNRVNTYPARHGERPSNITEVITQTGFDAYKQKTPPFQTAMKFMDANTGWVMRLEEPSTVDSLNKPLTRVKNIAGKIYISKQASIPEIIQYLSPRSQDENYKEGLQSHSAYQIEREWTSKFNYEPSSKNIKLSPAEKAEEQKDIKSHGGKGNVIPRFKKSKIPEFEYVSVEGLKDEDDFRFFKMTEGFKMIHVHLDAKKKKEALSEKPHP